jgi:aryl-alcohol dehydrogenase-like predicted oxidoreductase
MHLIFFLPEEYPSKHGMISGRLTEFSNELGISIIHLSLAWCLKNPDVSTVILGASNVDQLKENLKAADVVEKLTSDVMERIEKIVQSKPKAWIDW